MLSPTELTQYYIKAWSLDHSTSGTYRHDVVYENGTKQLKVTPNLCNLGNGLKMEIVFKRRLTNELLTTYLPSFLLLLISYATTWFKPFYFEAAVTVNLSVMLVTTTLFIRF